MLKILCLSINLYPKCVFCLHSGPLVISEHFKKSLWHIQSLTLSEYSEYTLGSGQGGGAAMPSNLYTTSQMGAI